MFDAFMPSELEALSLVTSQQGDALFAAVWALPPGEGGELLRQYAAHLQTEHAITVALLDRRGS